MTKLKMVEKKPKTKPTCNSAFHFSLHFHKLCLYKTTLKYWKLCSHLLKMTKPKTPEKAKKRNKLATVHFTTYYPSANCTFTERH